jgi:aminopeptidase N
MGSTPFWAAIRAYIAAHRFGLVHTRTLLDAIDAASPIDFAARWQSRFPSLY